MTRQYLPEPVLNRIADRIAILRLKDSMAARKEIAGIIWALEALGYTPLSISRIINQAEREAA